MKKFVLFAIMIVGMFSCSNSQYDLEKMGDAVKQHIRYRDTENGTTTKIEHIKALSYEKTPEDRRENPDEVYTCRVFIQGTWAYANSNRVFNINDTIDCYFSSGKQFIRMQDIYANY